MRPIPILLDIPHSGTHTPEEAKPYSILTEDQLRYEADLFADEIYTAQPAIHKVTSPFWRTHLDMNRLPDDFSADGIVKTHTNEGELVYKNPAGLPKEVAERLIRTHAHPDTPGSYYDRLRIALEDKDTKAVLLAHTMVGKGPSKGACPGRLRPLFCLANGGDEAGNPQEEANLSSTTESTEKPSAITASGAPRQIMEFLKEEITRLIPSLNLKGIAYKQEVRFNHPFAAATAIQRLNPNRLAGRPAVLIEVNRRLFGDNEGMTTTRPENITAVQNIIRKLIEGLATNLLTR